VTNWREKKQIGATSSKPEGSIKIIKCKEIKKTNKIKKKE